jgi:hypothetical protein
MMANKSNYYELLKHPNWQKKRLQVLEDANWECEFCGSKEKTLHVHHKYYEKGLKPWEHPDHSLLCLCEDCHGTYQEQKERLKFVTKFLDFTDNEMLIGFAKGLISQEYLHWKMDLNSWEEAHGIALYWGLDADLILKSVENEFTGLDLQTIKEQKNKRTKELGKSTS